MNKTNTPHPAFHLNGVPFHDDPDEFFRHLSGTFPAGGPATDYAQDIQDFIREYLDAKAYVVCHTSGSTGTPKPIRLEKRRMEASARLTIERFDLPPGSRALLCLPVSYIAGKMMLVRAMIGGWDLTATPPSSRFMEQVTGRFDFAAVVPMQLYRSAGQLHRIDRILVGGGSVSEAFLDTLPTLNLPRTTLYQSYAMTETITHVALRQLYPSRENAYTALDGVSFSLSPHGTLRIHAPALCADTVTTNDIGELTDDKHFIWQGRADTVINSGGIKIFPEDTENVLSRFLTGRYFVAGRPDDLLGTRQVLFVEGTPEQFPGLEAFLETHFDAYHRPKEMFFIPRFPLTHTGKIDRRHPVFSPNAETREK